MSKPPKNTRFIKQPGKSTIRRKKKFRIISGDTVIVIAGDHKGKRGDVLKVIPEKDAVIVGGINIRKTRSKQRDMQRQYISREFPIHISNVSLIDEKTDLKTRIKYEMREVIDGDKRFLGNKKCINGKMVKKVRVTTRSGEIVFASNSNYN